MMQEFGAEIRVDRSFWKWEQTDLEYIQVQICLYFFEGVLYIIRSTSYNTKKGIVYKTTFPWRVWEQDALSTKVLE